MAGLLSNLFGMQAQVPGSTQQQGLLGSLLDPAVALPIAGQLMGDQGNWNNIGRALTVGGGAIAQTRGKNRTMDYFRQNAPEFAAMIDAGMPMEEAWGAYTRQRFAEPADVRYSMSPVYGTDPETGETVLGTVGNDGSFKRIDTGGFEVASGIDKIDGGTHWLLYDKRTGQLVGREEKNIRGAAAEKEIGESLGGAAAAAGADVQAGQNALDLLADIRNDPYRARGTGGTSVFNAIPGTGGKDFQLKVDQATSGAFLSAIEQLRGMGALSNVEGQTARAAVTRMNTAASEDAFVAALDDYEKIVRQGMEKARRVGSQFGVPMPDASPAPADGAVDYRDYF